MTMAILRITALLYLLAFARFSAAHQLSDSFLKIDLNEGGLSAWEISLRDLEEAVALDANSDLQITWAEVLAKTDDIKKYAFGLLKLQVGEALLTPEFAGLSIADRSGGKYAVLDFTLPAVAMGRGLKVRYDLLFDLDAQHRGLLRIAGPGQTTAHVFSQDDRAFEFAGADPGRNEFLAFFRQGVIHIWKGFDHVLFLVALLIPAVLVRRMGRWEAAGELRPVLAAVIKTVTAFTIAHSITLTLASLNWIAPPAGVIEPIIAASVVLAALNNVFAWFQEKLWGFAFAFGLVHGFGFAYVLRDLGLDKGALFMSLAGFNLGVEAGQLALVALIVPAAFFLRSSRSYRPLVLNSGSACIALLAFTWMLERVLNFKVLPF